MAVFPWVAGDIPVYRGDSRTFTFAFKDGTADGPALDLSAYGSVVTSQARLSPDGVVLLTLDTTPSDLVNGIVAFSVSPALWAPIASQFTKRTTSVGFDIQVADPDGSRVTTVVAGTLVVSRDYTHDAYEGS